MLNHHLPRSPSSMASPDDRKQSLYFPAQLLEEIRSEARRLDRPISWVVQTAWRIARAEIRRYPGPDDAPHAPEGSNEA